MAELKIEQYNPMSGRLIKENNLTINRGDVLADVWDKGEIVVVNTPNLAIKNGYSFVGGYIFYNVAVNAYAVLHFKSGTKPIYITYLINTSAEIEYGLRRDMVITGNGTELSTPCRNLVLNSNTDAKLYHTPTYSNIGTLVVPRYLALTNSPRGNAADIQTAAVVLPPNTSLFYTAQNKGNQAGNVNIVIDFFEIQI